MRALIVTPQCPYPPRSGGSLRNFNIIRQLSARHEVHLISYIDPGAQLESSSPLRDHVKTITLIPAPRRTPFDRLAILLLSRHPDMVYRLRSQAMTTAVAQALKSSDYDVVQLEGLEMAPALLDTRDLDLNTAVIYDAHNAEHMLQKRAYEVGLSSPTAWPGAAYSWAQWRRLMAYEALVCRSVDGVVATSEADRRALKALVPGLEVLVVPNGVDTEFYALNQSPVSEGDSPGREPGRRDEATILFTGTMDYRPNVDAVRWFCQEVFPMILAKVPHAQLLLVGRNPTGAVKALAGQNVTVTGYVDDDLAYFQGATVYVLPMRFGGGVRLKLLQAMACGLPVVSTTMGAEGVDVTHGQDVLLADDPHSFTAAVVQAITDPIMAQRLGDGARVLAESRYDWRAIVPRLETVYDEVVARKRAGRKLSLL